MEASKALVYYRIIAAYTCFLPEWSVVFRLYLQDHQTEKPTDLAQTSWIWIPSVKHTFSLKSIFVCYLL